VKYNTLIYQLSWQLGKLATTKCNPQFLDSLWRRAKAQNVTFQFLYSVQFTLSTDLTNPHFCASLPHWQTNHSSFLETNPFVWLCWCDSAWHEFSLVMGVITWHWVRYEKCSVITVVWNRSNSDQHEFQTDPIEIFVSSYEYAWYCKFENWIQVVQPQSIIIIFWLMAHDDMTITKLYQSTYSCWLSQTTLTWILIFQLLSCFQSELCLCTGLM